MRWTLKPKPEPDKIEALQQALQVDAVIVTLLLQRGVQTYQESSASLNLLGMEISANDESGQRSAMLYFALALASLAAGYFVWKKR